LFTVDNPVSVYTSARVAWRYTMNGYIRDILKHRDKFAGYNTVM